jgi:hypothetical protein
MKTHTYVLALLASVYLAGCAHPMNIKPDVQGLEPVSGRIEKNVGLYISAADRALEVTTAGGGGDKVRYHPYADMEVGLYKALGNVFASVTVLNSPTDSAAIASHSVSYIVEPTITTTSSSSGIFTWPATDFTVQVDCPITDPAGHQVALVSSTGIGNAEPAEARHYHSLAGERAAEDALQKLESALLQAPELKH